MDDETEQRPDPLEEAGMIDLDGIRLRAALFLGFAQDELRHRHLRFEHNAAVDLFTLIAEVERLKTALSRDVPHRVTGCPCRHPPSAHDSVLLCRGCVE
jgi:hypothetical protein